MWWIELTEHPSFSHWVLGVGILLLIVAIWLVTRKMQFLSKCRAKKGKVVVLKEDRTDNVWRPVVEFNDEFDKTYTFECVGSGPNPRYSVGDIVPVRYDPENPEKAYIDRWWRYWFVEFVVIVLGIGWIWGGLRNF